MMRLVSLILRDAEQRAARLTAPDRLDDSRMSAVIQSSTVVAVIDRGVSRFRRAAATSAANAIAQRTLAWWHGLPWTGQRFLSGVTLLVAIGVHLLLRIWQEPDPGWLWLIVPGTAAAVGALLVVASRRPEAGR